VKLYTMMVPSHFSKHFSIYSMDNNIEIKLGCIYLSSQCAACIAVYIYCPLKITQHIAIYCQNSWQQKWVVSDDRCTSFNHAKPHSCFCLLDRTIQIVVSCIRAVQICALRTILSYWPLDVQHGTS